MLHQKIIENRSGNFDGQVLGKSVRARGDQRKCNALAHQLPRQFQALHIAGLQRRGLSPLPVDPYRADGMDHEPELVRNAAFFLQSNSFIAYRLTGSVSQDLSQSYGWHNFDQRRLRYDEDLTRVFGIDRRFLLDMQYTAVRSGKVACDPEALVLDRIGNCIDEYLYATTEGGNTYAVRT